MPPKVAPEERSIEVDKMELTIVAESAVDEMEAAIEAPGAGEDRSIVVVETSTDSGTVSPISTFSVVCSWHSGCRGPSPSPSGISVVWMDRFRR